MNTGDIESGGSITAHDIITGLKIENLTVVLKAVDDLGRQVDQPHLGFRQGPEAGLEIVAGETPLLALPANVLEAFKLLPRRATTGLSAAERQRLYAAWLVTRQPVNPPQRVAAREHYIPLSGHTSWDWEEDLFQPRLSYLQPAGEGPERRFEREELADVAEAVQRFPAFVLLGPPGCGKSTVLERLAYTTARDYLAGRSQRLPLWLTLAFVRECWQAQVADDWVDLARAGHILLLVDGLNEMPRLEHPDDRAHRSGDWRRFVDEFFAEDSATGSRAIIASRDADDYEQRLGLPRVEIDPLDPDQTVRFARAYLGPDADTFLAELERLALQELARIPFSLYVLTRQYDPARRGLPPNRGQLFARYANDLLGVMYPQQDAQCQVALQALAGLGFALQETGEGTVLPAGDLLARLPARVSLPRRPAVVDRDQVFERAWRAGLLSLVNEDDDTFKFSHQLLQEQFAARHLLTRWQAGQDLTALWRTQRTQADMPDPNVGEWDPLPPPPATGWEQTTILAAGLTNRPAAFVGAVLAVNPALAGRCLSEGLEVDQIETGTRAAVQQALLADLSEPHLHRRTRLQAGQVLAGVADPRFEPVAINGARLILPELVAVPGGTATLGSDDGEADDNEQPVHPVEVRSFYLARYPLTNAEYDCFIRAGGYDTERCWTPVGWQWRQGQAETSGAVESILDVYRALVQNPNQIDELFNAGRIMRDTAEGWRALIELPEAQVRAIAEEQYGQRATDRPYYWTDPAYNGPTQPVVGLTWYEAMAYCAWLNELLAGGQAAAADLPDEVVRHLAGGEWQVRLPTEAEWEWAAGGPQHRTYPWGNEFEVDKANTLEGRVLRPSPVGAYPAGRAACGALDLSGNVWEWTHTLYRAYPYEVEDGREEPLAGGRRALRGGGWYGSRGYARVSARDRYVPGNFGSSLGFRLVVAPVFL